MEKQTLNSFPVIGITVRTCNADGSAARDIPELWNRFMAANITAKLSNIAGPEIYSIYTDYEGDYTQPYTTLIGYKVAHLDQVPEGLTGIMIGGGNYEKRTVKGNLHKGLVYDAWVDIWNSDLQRAYTADFEVYGAAAQNPEDAAVDIYISLQS